VCGRERGGRDAVGECCGFAAGEVEGCDGGGYGESGFVTKLAGCGVVW